VYARDQGVLTPTRLVYLAKSWLSNPEVDRREDLAMGRVPKGASFLR
jgi:hypothetical protein